MTLTIMGEENCSSPNSDWLLSRRLDRPLFFLQRKSICIVWLPSQVESASRLLRDASCVPQGVRHEELISGSPAGIGCEYCELLWVPGPRRSRDPRRGVSPEAVP